MKMKNILKQLGEWDISLNIDDFKKATLVLSARYSVLILIILSITGVLSYMLFLYQSGVTIGDGPLMGIFDEDSHVHEESERLLTSLFSVIGFVWLVSTIFAYFLASKTLLPIQKNIEEQEQFIADASHELRTPLSVLKLGSETLLKKDRSADEYKKYIIDVLAESNRLMKLTNDLLSSTHTVHEFTESRQSINISDIVTAQTEAIMEYAQEHSVSLASTIEKDIYIRGRAIDIERVCSNLLKNAIDYNVKKGSVTITLIQENSRATLVISDTGVGIPETDLPHVFKRLYKGSVSRTQTDDSSAGLGLSLVKEIIDRHDGDIAIQSIAGEGTIVTIHIPCV